MEGEKKTPEPVRLENVDREAQPCRSMCNLQLLGDWQDRSLGKWPLLCEDSSGAGRRKQRVVGVADAIE